MAVPIHRDHARHFLYGALGVVVAVFLLTLGLKPLFGGGVPLMPYTYVTADFKDVGTLRPGLDVRENSVSSGKVTEVKVENGQAVVTVRLDGDQPVYRDAHATILDESALAQKFVNLDRGHPQAGPLGNAIIPESQTESSVGLDDVFNVFDPQTRQALGSTVRELGTGLGGRGEELSDGLHAAPGLLGDLGQISGALSSDQAELAPLLISADRLTGRFAGHTENLNDLVRNADATLQAVQVDSGKPLASTLNKLPPTLRDARTALEALDTPLTDVQSTVQTLQPGAHSLGDATPDLRGVLRESVQPLDKVPGVADDAKPAVSDLTDTFSAAKPLAPQLAETVKQANSLLGGLSPYSQDAGRLFHQKDLLARQVGPDKHTLSIQLVFPGLNFAGLRDPSIGPENYPAPNQAGPKHPEGQLPDGGDQ